MFSPILRMVTLVGALGSLCACAGTTDGGPPGLAYAEAASPEFPRKGASIDETLRGIVPPRTTNALVQARDIRVLRIDVDPAEPLSEDGAAAHVAATPGAHHAVIVSLNCQSRANLNRIWGEKVAWYLLRDGKLTAWDHWEFGDACTMFDQFEPARGDDVGHEKRLLGLLAGLMPASIVHASELYAKGIAYARADRMDDARAMLEAGDRAFDATADQKIDTNEGRDTRYTGNRGSLRGGRTQLVGLLKQADAKVPAVSAP